MVFKFLLVQGVWRKLTHDIISKSLGTRAHIVEILLEPLIQHL